MNLRANHNLAQRLRQANRLPEAEQMLLQSIAYCERHNYESFPLHGDLAEIYVYAGQFDQAYERFQITIEAANATQPELSKYHQLLRNRKLAETRTSFGALLDLMQRPAEAARQFDLAIELRPDVAEWYVMAGHAHRQAGNVEMALDRWKHATQLAPARVDVARDYSILLVDAGHYREAAERLRQGVKQHPDDLAMQFQLARLEAAAPVEEIRQPEAALNRCKLLLKTNPEHAFEIQSVQAMALGNAGRTNEAIALLETLRRQTSATDAEVRKDLDMMSVRFGQRQQVLLTKPH